MHVVVRPHLISRGALAVMVVTAVVGVLATGVIHPSVASADPTPSCDATTCTVDFVPAGSVQQWSVPAGVSSVTVAMAAGSGASSAAGGVGGAGGEMMATVPAEWGETFSVVVGTAAANSGGGFGGGGAAGPPRPGPGVGGGGGGGSFVFETFPTTTRASRRRRRRGRRWRQQRDRRCGWQQRPRLGCDHHQRRWHRGRPRRHPGRRRCGRSRQPGPVRQRLGWRRTGHGAQQPRSRRQWRCFEPGGHELGRRRRRGLLRRRGRRCRRSAGHQCGSRRRRFGLQRPEHHRGLHLDQHRRRLGHHHLPRPGDDDDIGGLARRHHRCCDPQQLRRVLTGRLPRPNQLRQRGGRRHLVLHHRRVRPVQPGLLHHGQRGLQPTDPAHSGALVVHQPAVERDR